MVSVPFINGMGLHNLILKREWLDSVIELFAQVEDKTFVDVGVNIGQSLIRFKTICPQTKYLGFEPNSTCVAYAQKLISVNKFQGCIIQNAALSTGVSNLILEKTTVDDSRASLISALRPNYFEDKEHVIALDYDTFYFENEISFVKIDVEGGEFEVLKGMERSLKRHQPLVVCEVLDSLEDSVLEFTQKRASMVCELLDSLGCGIIQLHTKNNKLMSFERIDKIIIKQWTTESPDFNDYLFYPLVRESDVLEKLMSLVTLKL